MNKNTAAGHKNRHVMETHEQAALRASELEEANQRLAHLLEEQKRISAELAESQRRYDQLALQNRSIAWEVNADGLYTYVSQVVEPVLGYKPEELVGRKHFYDLYPEQGREAFKQSAFEIMRRKGEFLGLVNAACAKDGHVVWLSTNGIPLLDENGNQKGYRGSDTDISERKLAEEHLRFHAQLLDCVSESLVATDMEGRIRYWGRGAERLYGYTSEQVMNKPYRDFAGAVDPPDEEAFRREIIARGAWHGEHVQRRRDGTLFWTSTFISPVTDEHGRPAGFIGIDQDISERKQAEAERQKLQEQLSQAHKMESVGLLAGGVAHDFNNMLAVILGHTELALDGMNPAQPLYSDLQQIRKAAERSCDLTRQLLAFARKQTIAPRTLNLNETVGSMIKMLRRLIGEDIQLRWLPSEPLWTISMDPVQIDQILANLCLNARDAITGIGAITIETANQTISPEPAPRHPEIVPGDYVLLVVGDTGHGMDRETLAHIFEPFFTTKKAGEGTGLGLATVYGIVKQNNGYIYVCSEPGQGSTFTIYLPRQRETAESPDREAASPPPRQERATILLVEDEPASLAMIQRLLQRLGHTVLAAQSPAAALRLAQAHHGEIHLMLADVVMPEMNGRELYDRISAFRKDTACIFMSGYPANVIAHRGILDTGMHFLHKPFSMHDLARMIHKVLT